MGPTGRAELVASQRSLQQCTARRIALPAVARSGIRCSAAQSVATRRHPLHPGKATASCRDAAAIRSGILPSTCDGGRSASSSGYSHLRHHSRAAHFRLSSARCAGMRCAWFSPPLRARICVWGTALLAATADGVPRLPGTHTCGTIVARRTFGFLPLGAQVCAVLGSAHPYAPA